MKGLLSVVYHSWLLLSLGAACYGLLFSFSLAWFGVLLVSLPALLNRLYCFDSGDSPSSKVRYPRLSLLMLCGVAWVLLTIPELGWPLWLVLGCLGGFLLHSYWVKAEEVEKEGHLL